MTAQWAARYGHSTVIDAAGAIYVIGGTNNTNFFNDVSVSTDGGALPNSAGGRGVHQGGTMGGGRGGTGGTQRARGVLGCTKGYSE